jgi:hypothetical protein
MHTCQQKVNAKHICDFELVYFKRKNYRQKSGNQTFKEINAKEVDAGCRSADKLTHTGQHGMDVPSNIP